MNISRFNREQLRLTMRFDNDEVYVAETYNRGDRVLETCVIQESEGNTHGNPLGIMSSNSINFTIYDRRGVLIKSNKSSPYFGFMRNGVECKLEWRDNEGEFHPLGTYYTNGWDNTRSDGGFQSVNISAQDRLNYIGNLNIPELPAFSSIEIKSLLIELFKAIGLSESEYYIDPTLNLTLTFSVTRGAKLRDTLNAIAQVLIARVTIDRRGVICIRPAFPVIPDELDIVDGDTVTSGTLKQNQYTDYATVQLSFYELGIESSVVLATVNNVNVNNGENSFDNIVLNNKVQGIDLVTYEFPVTSENYDKAINDINYTGFQGGVSIKVTSELPDVVNGTLTIEGRETGDSEVVLSKEILSADRKVSNTLMLSSDYIQTRQQATEYLNNVVDYISKMRNSGKFSQSLVGFMLETGKYIQLNSNNSEIDGVYYVTDITFQIGETFSCSFDAIKFES